MKRIKILYGLEAVGGGALKHLAYLVDHIDKELFDITVILSSNRDEDACADIEKIRNAGVNLIYHSIRKEIHIVSDFYNTAKLIAIFKEGKFDIIHPHSSKAGGLFRIAAFMVGCKHVLYTPHCFYFQGLSGVKRNVYIGLEKILAKITSYIVVSEGERKEIIKNKIISERQILNINNAIDFNEYIHTSEIKDIRSTYDIPEGKFIVGSVGRLAPQKDWETFIFAASEVLKSHPETIFLITGDGELRNELLKLIFALGLEKNVILTGYVQDIYKIFGIIDVFVSTSLWEGLPYVILEAMKYKKPIITTDTGNQEVIAHDRSGFIIPVKNYRAVANKISELIQNKQKAIQMGEEAYEILTRKYSFEAFIASHEEAYKRMVANSER